MLFEGSTPDAFETTLAVVDPTADRTITLPNVSGTVVTTGDTGTVTSTMILDGTIANVDINASAAIAFSKLAALTSAHILVGNASNVAAAVNLTGDINIDNAGVSAIASGVIVNADVNVSAAIAGSKIQAATTSNAGAVQLTDSYNSTSTTTAATPASVKTAFDLADLAGTVATAALPKAGGTMTGNITLNAQSDVRFADADSSNWVAFQAPATVTSNVTWTLPAADGTVDQVLKTDGSGALGWASPSVSGPILENQQVIGASYTLSTGYNGISAGPVAVGATYTVTVPAGAVWVII